jgi:hypothetical protein
MQQAPRFGKHLENLLLHSIDVLWCVSFAYHDTRTFILTVLSSRSIMGWKVIQL